MSLQNVVEPWQAEEAGFLAEWVEGSDSLLIALGGMARKYRRQGPQVGFQFYAATRSYPVNRVYLRDNFNSWYHHGHPPIAESIDETAERILELMQGREIRRIIVTGISAGGYGALLLGWLLEADEVHAVTPQTYIDFENRLKNDDFLGEDFLEDLYQNPRSRIDYFDLRPLLESTPEIRTQFHIYYCEKHRIDTCHAMHLQGLPGVVLHPYEEGAHRLSMHLARSGELQQIIMSALRIA